jgi:hypothetical protein
VQGFDRADRQLLDAAALARHVIPENSMFAFLAHTRAEVFPDADYADLFSPAGRGPATQMAAVLIWQALHDFGPGDRRGGPVRRAVEGGDRRGTGR